MAELCKDLKIFTDRDYDLMVIGEGVFGTGIQSDSRFEGEVFC
jgi:glycerol-3-phosphate dehydrogenase